MTSQEAYEKCIKEKKRIIELEDLIATDLEYSYFYARDIIKEPWKRGEEVISNYHPELFL